MIFYSDSSDHGTHQIITISRGLNRIRLPYHVDDETRDILNGVLIITKVLE